MKVRTGIEAGKGLGDVVADIIQATGLDVLATEYTRLTGQSCGCQERQEALNNLFPNVVT
jgi:hypothetical protein